jgi:hypothetical protein
MALLLWSGGVDSTALLHMLLAAKRDQTISQHCINAAEIDLKIGEEVRTLSISHPQVAAYKENATARHQITEKLNQYFQPFKSGCLHVSHEDIDALSSGDGITQPTMWITIASIYLEKAEDLYLGYIAEDDFWHHAHLYREAFAAIQRVTQRTGQLRLPLEWATKADMIEYCKKHGLLKHTWHCEAPKTFMAPCGRCSPCKKHQTALLYAKWQTEQDEKDSKKVVKIERPILMAKVVEAETDGPEADYAHTKYDNTPLGRLRKRPSKYKKPKRTTKPKS